MIKAIFSSNDGTLILEFPRSIYDIYEKLQSIGIRQSPRELHLADNEDDPVKVKLYAENDLGNHLIHLMRESDTVADANMLAYLVEHASPDIRRELEGKLLADRYHCKEEAVRDIRQMTRDAGPIKVTYYCPLTGNMDVGEDELFPIGNAYLRGYAWAIEEAVKADAEKTEDNMADFFDADAGVKAKLVSAEWGVEEYRGQLFGRIECSLKEALSEKEDLVLRDWICGQNADGWGEHFEQIPIDTEEGDLYVSFWHSGNDYSIMTQDELDEYIENQGMWMGGM